MNEDLKYSHFGKITYRIKGTYLGNILEEKQLDAWKNEAFKHRLNDSTFLFSGVFDPPPEVANALFKQMLMTGRAVFWDSPLITKEPLDSIYQEKLSYPFIFSAWDRLVSFEQVPKDLSIGDNVFVATVPNGRIYPEIFGNNLIGYLIIFDSNLLILMELCIRILVRFFPSKIESLYSYWFESLSDYTPASKGENIYFSDEVQLLASLLLEFLISGNALTLEPIMKIYRPRQDLTQEQEEIVSIFLDDMFTFILAHELGHIQCNHFNKAGKEINTTNKNDYRKREFQADLHAFAALANCSRDSISQYYNICILFHIMNYLYRLVHFSQFGQDYGHLPEKLQAEIILGAKDQYPHPAYRLFSLRESIAYSARKELPEKIDIEKINRGLDFFFFDIWRGVLFSIIRVKPELWLKHNKIDLPKIYDYLISYHKKAYEKLGFSYH